MVESAVDQQEAKAREKQQNRLMDVQVDDERMSDGWENFLLVLDVVDLLEFEHLGDGEHLECEEVCRRRVLDKNDSPERSRPCSVMRSCFDQQLH